MRKVFLIITITFLITGIGSGILAASYNFNFTGPSEATNGQTVTLTVTGSGLTGKVLLSSSNATLSSQQVWVEKNSVSITAKITGFPAKITATPSELTDDEYNIVNIASKTITINEKKTTPTTPTTPPTGGNNQGNTGSSGGGSNSGGSTSSGSNKPSTSKPNTTTKPNTGSSSQHSPDQTTIPNESNIQNGNIKSSNNYLQSITLSTGNLSPEFYRETFEYTIENVSEDVNEIEIAAVAEDERSNISGLGKFTIEPGENKFKVSVTAENGNVREYTLNINRKEQLKESDLRLKTLEIRKINREGEFSNLDLEFDKEKFEYNVEVEEDIEDLDINATVEREGIILDVTGEKNLKEGENKVTITLTSQEDNSIQTIYTINVNKDVPIETLSEVVKANTNWKMVVIWISLGILVIEIIIYIVLKKKGKIK